MDKKVLLAKLGKRIAFLREQKGLSQSDLARLTNKDRQSIHKVEKGQFNPTIHYLSEIADALEISITDLVNI